MSSWFYRAGDLTRDGWHTVVDTTLDGWHHTGLKVTDLTGPEVRHLEAGEVERLVIPLSGSFHVQYTLNSGSDAAHPGTVDLVGRRSVFHGPPDVVYLPVGTSARISGSGRVAVAEAPATEAHPFAYIPKNEVPVELRGAGRSSRQIHNFGTPAAIGAAKFIVCEVITPAENWSSFPPHKHDEYVPGVESHLEEIYYFETAVSRGLTAPEGNDPFALFATYSSNAGQIEINKIVRSGDVALVPYGYHGPVAASPGYDVYYLNVMAGPGERIWNITDDPAHGWLRGVWEGQEFDPRLPYLEEETS